VHVLTGEDLSILWLTLRAATAATLIILPVGVALGWALSRWSGPWRTVLETFVSLPFVLPPTAVGLLLLSLLRRAGPAGRILDHAGVEVLFTLRAVVLASAIMSFPFLVRFSRAAFEEIDPRLLVMARTLGDSPVAAFRRVALPLAWRGILGGTLMAFSRALGEFGATILVAGSIPGRTQTLALAIFQRSQIGQDAAAMRLVGLSVALAFALVLVTEVLKTRRERRLRPS
jgi:molybdate transport system permease protein